MLNIKGNYKNKYPDLKIFNADGANKNQKPKPTYLRNAPISQKSLNTPNTAPTTVTETLH